MTEHPDCPTCICGRRAPVQGEHHPHGDPRRRGPGTIAWSEHEQAYVGYAAEFPGSASGQSAVRLAERGGFSYGELQRFLGHDPVTWVVRGGR